MTKVQHICIELKKRLQDGTYRVGSRFPSELALAEEFDVNRKTANVAVSLLEKEGYVQRKVRGGGTIVSRQTLFPEGYIVYLAPFSVFNNRILNGVQSYARENGYAVVVLYVDGADILSVINQLNAQNICGIIAAEFTLMLTDPLQYPVVVVDNEEQQSATDALCCVNTDNYRGGYDLMREVLRRGHREVAVCTGRYDILDRRNRVRGFTDAMAEADISAIDNRIFRSAFHDDREIAAVFDEIFARQPKTTLIACDGDETAAALFKEALRRGISVPKKLAITSYGNTLSSLLPLASIDQEPEKIGQAAASHLFEMIRTCRKQSPSERIAPQMVAVEHIPDLTRRALKKAIYR